MNIIDEERFEVLFEHYNDSKDVVMKEVEKDVRFMIWIAWGGLVLGFSILKKIAELNGIEIVVIEKEEADKSLQEELVKDLISLISSFSGKFYGLRSRLKRALR